MKTRAEILAVALDVVQARPGSRTCYVGLRPGVTAAHPATSDPRVARDLAKELQALLSRRPRRMTLRFENGAAIEATSVRASVADEGETPPGLRFAACVAVPTPDALAAVREAATPGASVNIRVEEP